MATMQIKLTDGAGNAFFWKCWREARVMNVGGNLERPYTGPMWMLERHDGACHGLESSWVNSVPRIHEIAEGYGFTAAVS